MQLHVTIEMGQGRIDDVRVFESSASAELAENQWCNQEGIQDETDRECKEMNGTEFRVFVCELEP